MHMSTTTSAVVRPALLDRATNVAAARGARRRPAPRQHGRGDRVAVRCRDRLARPASRARRAARRPRGRRRRRPGPRGRSRRGSRRVVGDRDDRRRHGHRPVPRGHAVQVVADHEEHVARRRSPRRRAARAAVRRRSRRSRRACRAPGTSAPRARRAAPRAAVRRTPPAPRAPRATSRRVGRRAPRREPRSRGIGRGARDGDRPGDGAGPRRVQDVGGDAEVDRAAGARGRARRARAARRAPPAAVASRRPGAEAVGDDVGLAAHAVQQPVVVPARCAVLRPASRWRSAATGEKERQASPNAARAFTKPGPVVVSATPRPPRGASSCVGGVPRGLLVAHADDPRPPRRRRRRPRTAGCARPAPRSTPDAVIGELVEQRVTHRTHARHPLRSLPVL